MVESNLCEKCCKLVKISKKEMVESEDENGKIQTTYRRDYVEKELPKRIERKMEKVYKSVPLESVTTYMNDYKEVKMPEPERRVKAEKKANLPFEGISTYTTDYSLKAWEYLKG